MQKGRAAEEIADNLELDIDMTIKLIELIVGNPQSDDLELARQWNDGNQS